MNPHKKQIRLRRSDLCRGTAAVECAIVLPLLTLLVLGAIDVGQYGNVYQKVSDASRAGARVAARHDTAATSSVESAVRDYLREVSRGTSGTTMASAVQVTVTDGTGNSVPAGNLNQIASGAQLSVKVSLQYDPVRWISGFKGLDGSEISSTTLMRRE
jgi:Flp pilus assembly protein TadG